MAGDELDKFVADILEAKQFTTVDDEVRTQLLSDLKKELIEQINTALVEALPEEKVEGLNMLFGNPDTTDEEITQYIVESGVDVQRVTAQTMLFFRGLYLQTPEEREG